MRKFLTIIVLLFISFSSYSQTKMKVVSFAKNYNDLDARVNEPKLDFNGDKSAIIKIETTEKGFGFDAGQIGVVDVVDSKIAEVWVYIPKGAIRLDIKHQKFGILKYEFPVAIEEAVVYNMVLSTPKSSDSDNEIENQYLIFNIDPKDEDVQLSIDGGVSTTISNGEAAEFLPIGTHTYEIKSDFYKTVTGTVVVNDEQVIKNIKMEPNFGYLSITANTKADVIINDFPVGTTPYKSQKLALGSYRVRLSVSNCDDFSDTCVLSTGGETVNVSANLKSNLSTITLTAAMSDAKIYVNNEFKAIGKWSGNLKQGNYEVRVEKEGHKSTSKAIYVEMGKSQTLTLESPIPLYGSLNVNAKQIGAEVSVDGVVLGKAPNVFKKILVGEHTVKISKEGYRTDNRNVNITENKISELVISLTKEIISSNSSNVITQKNNTNAHTDKSQLLSLHNMIMVEGGTFQMGSNSSDSDSDEKPIHSVTLSSYYIGKYEVTQQEWQDIMGSNPSYSKGTNKPVEKVTWYDCIKFCNALSRKAGLEECYTINGNNVRMDITKNGFRLPTEAEWEFASRGGAKSKGYKYSGSNTIGSVAWCEDNSSSQTHPVGEKSPNELGIYDMSGNVWERCWDWKGNYSSNSQTNPTGATSGSDRVFRGGSCSHGAWYCRSAYRNGSTPAYSSFNLGLRLVRRP